MLNIKQIQEIIPHRYPFLLVDKVIEDLEPGIKAVGYKNVTMNEYFFKAISLPSLLCPGYSLLKLLRRLSGMSSFP